MKGRRVTLVTEYGKSSKILFVFVIKHKKTFASKDCSFQCCISHLFTFLQDKKALYLQQKRHVFLCSVSSITKNSLNYIKANEMQTK